MKIYAEQIAIGDQIVKGPQIGKVEGWYFHARSGIMILVGNKYRRYGSRERLTIERKP